MGKYENFGTRLEKLRIRAGIETQADLARRLGVKQQTVSRWELGTSRPREKELAVIAKQLAADVDELGQPRGGPCGAGPWPTWHLGSGRPVATRSSPSANRAARARRRELPRAPPRTLRRDRGWTTAEHEGGLHSPHW